MASRQSSGDGRVLSIQSHVVHGYVGNNAATFPLQVRPPSPRADVGQLDMLLAESMRNVPTCTCSILFMLQQAACIVICLHLMKITQLC